MLMTEWNWDDAKEVWQEEAREEERQFLLDLLSQGLSIDEIKHRLDSKDTDTKGLCPSEV
jgi:DNA-binding transcriptional MerR regulator